MSELLQILERTVSQNPADQELALSFLRQACETNYAEFARQLATVLSTVEHPSFVRQAAGLQLKNTLVAKEQALIETFRNRWLSLTGEIKSYIKECVLRTLGTESQRPSTAAQCIAAIACIELPANEWIDLINLLSSNVTKDSSTEMQRESSLEALGYICQDMPAAMMERSANPILTAIVHGMREEETSLHVRLAATNALLNSLEFARHNFENENERNVIMQVTCNATQSSETKIRVAALQCLVRIMSLYYRHMEPYMGRALFHISVQAMKDPDDEVALQGIEFWSNVCDEELALAAEAEEAEEQCRTPEHVSRHYALGALTHILPTLTDTLAKQENEAAEDEWMPAKSAGVCIMLLAQCCGDAIVDPILPFISQHFVNSDWHYREAAIMAFGSILEGPSKQNLDRLVEVAIQPLIVTLSDNHLAVRDTAAWAIGRVCDTCERLVVNEQTLATLLPALFNALQDQPRVATNVCWALSSLVKAAYEVAREQGTDGNDTPQTFVLSNVFQNMIAELIKTSERTDSSTNNLRIAAYEALMELIKNSPADCYPVVQQTTMLVLSKLESLLAVEDALVTASDRSQLRDLQSQLCATLQSVLHKLRHEDAPVISDAIMAGLLQIMSRCNAGKDSGAVIEEALMAITSLIDVLKGVGFEKYLPSFKPYLFAALDNHEDPQVCMAAIGVVSDLCRAFEANIFALMDEIMAKLLAILHDPRVKRAVKTQVLNAFGDVALALNQQYARYLESNMKWLTEAIAAAQITNPEDYEQVEYVEALRESCCYAFSGIVQAMTSDSVDANGQTSNSNGVQLLQKYVQPIITLVVQIATSQPTPPDSLCASACALVGDLLRAFGVQFLPVIESQDFGVMGLLQHCRKSKLTKAKTIVNWVHREIQRVKRATT